MGSPAINYAALAEQARGSKPSAPRIDYSTLAAQARNEVDLRPRNIGTKPDAPEQESGWRSFYNGAIKPVFDLVMDAHDRGDLGEHAAGEILSAFRDQVRNFAGHPDIRNLPIVGTGATATAARMQKQYDAGNYTGMIGSAAGFLAPFAAPEIVARAPGAAAAVKTGAGKLRAALPNSVPEIPGTAINLAGLVHPGAAHAIALANRAGKVANKILESTAPAGPLSPSETILASMKRSTAEQVAIDEAYARLPDAPAEAPIETPAPEAAAPLQTGEATPRLWPARPVAAAPQGEPQWEPGPAGTPEPWQPYQAPATAPAPQWEPGPAGTPEPAAGWEPYRAPAAPGAAPAVPARAAVPELTAAQRLEDAADEHALRLQHQAEDIIWANRARKADRFADYLTKNKLDPTPENLATAARELAERAAPSDETVPMIHDRMGYEPPAAAEPDLAQQLQDSLDAAGKKKRDGAAPQAVQSGSDGQRAAEIGQSGTREAVHEPVRAASPATRTSVDVPGEARSFGANYEVRELGELQPSHHGDSFQPTPKYAIENDRNYDDPVNQRKIIDWSVQGPTGFKPRNLLNTAPDSSSGPPVIDSAGNVIGGNGRTMIVGRVYKTNPAGAQAYRAELDRTAGHYGIDPKSYAGMKEPVLVRTIDDAEFAAPGAKQRAVTDFNKVGTASLTPSERAIADARGVSLSSLDDIAARMEREGTDATLSQVLEGRHGVEVLRNLVKDGVISPQESAALGGESKLTRAGKDRISGLMLGRFFTNAKQMDALPDAIRNKMERIAAPLARVEGSAEYSLSPHIRRALDLLEDAAAHGAATLDDFLAQKGLFENKKFSAEAIALAKQLRNRDPLALTNAVRAYAEHAKYASEYQGPGMFPGSIPEPLTPAEAFAESFGRKALDAEAKAKAAKKQAAAAAAKTPAIGPVKTLGDLGNLK